MKGQRSPTTKLLYYQCFVHGHEPTNFVTHEYWFLARSQAKEMSSLHAFLQCFPNYGSRVWKCKPLKISPHFSGNPSFFVIPMSTRLLLSRKLQRLHELKDRALKSFSSSFIAISQILVSFCKISKQFSIVKFITVNGIS